MKYSLDSSIHNRTVKVILMTPSLKSSQTHNPTELFARRTLPKMALRPRNLCLSESDRVPSSSTPRQTPKALSDLQNLWGEDEETGEQLPETLQDRINLLMSRLDEQQRRWFVAIVAEQLGRGGIQKMSQMTGMHPDTIRRGRKELEAGLVDRPKDRARRSGGGRPGKSPSTDRTKSNKKTRE